ncbi:MAG TPA: hypothetical protein DCX32_04655 [Candidatus Moranbacteria bacterium]|nr:MAG: hypothetical protein UW87_C0001G0022 [Candidatus Moranbacteria bacterium GW2011_GWC2_45_10]KKT94946.1 MAG: hypothetical protein UW95_C0006G0011 [Parcubacteria group bacterium GW2011_GWC1_45_14]HAV11799.1 hypothetical protein [Candidatus Moranbacteria bacterium]
MGDESIFSFLIRDKRYEFADERGKMGAKKFKKWFSWDIYVYIRSKTKMSDEIIRYFIANGLAPDEAEDLFEEISQENRTYTDSDQESFLLYQTDDEGGIKKYRLLINANDEI